MASVRHDEARGRPDRCCLPKRPEGARERPNKCGVDEPEARRARRVPSPVVPTNVRFSWPADPGPERSGGPRPDLLQSVVGGRRAKQVARKPGSVAQRRCQPAVGRRERRLGAGRSPAPARMTERVIALKNGPSTHLSCL